MLTLVVAVLAVLVFLGLVFALIRAAVKIFVLAGMVLDSGAAATPSARAKSIREGDVSVTFATGISGEDEQEMLACFRTELDRYRRMDW